MVALSIIIPLSAHEANWPHLLEDLAAHASILSVSEILIILHPQTVITDKERARWVGANIRWVRSRQPGRAVQMNRGADLARGEHLWFLHADSRCSCRAIDALLKAQQAYPDRLLYFDLAFLQDGPCLMRLNALGAYFRSRVLHFPFGDQGFCLRKTLFRRLGGFSEEVAYGEDHLLVWAARDKGICLQPVGAKLHTSARHYQTRGWLKSTCWRQYLWVKQAWPQWRRLQRLR